MKYVILTLILLIFAQAEERMQIHMGTYIRVQTDHYDYADEVFALFADLDQKLSSYKSDSEVSRLNRGESVNLSDMTVKILQRSLEMNRISNGAFDITVGGLTHTGYRFGYEDERLIDDYQRKALASSVGADKLKIEKNQVILSKGSIIDLGGIAKGYAVDLSIQKLQQLKAGRSIVAASGDIGCLGKCSVQIQNPFVPQGYIAEVVSSLPRFAISTSGNYERYIASKEHNHLIDPKSGKSQQRYASITLMDRSDNTRIDALATAVALMEEDAALAMLDEQKIGYVIVKNDQSCIRSKPSEGIEITMKIIECKER